MTSQEELNMSTTYLYSFKMGSEEELKNKKWIGLLCVGDSFKIRKNGIWHTVHAHVIEQKNDDDSNTGRGDFFTITVSNGRMYAFHHMDKYIISSNDI